MFQRGLRVGILGIAKAINAIARRGNVLPASADARGYPLENIAKATAVFDAGLDAVNPITPPPKVM
jgi:hypothetical protein